MFASGQNVGALKCRRPKMSASIKMSAPIKMSASIKMSAFIKYSKSKRHLRLHIKYSKSTNICAYMKCWRPVKHVGVL
ncbi:MAG: hypothetical protein ACK53Y_10015 [bacterium]